MRKEDYEKSEDYLCKVARECRYGAPMSGSGHFYGCDYIGMMGKSRFSNGAKKAEIINGRCGCFEELKDARTRARAKNRYKNAEKGRYEP